MSVYRDVDIKITGQVPDDYSENDYKVLLAKLNVIVAEHGLEMVEA